MYRDRQASSRDCLVSQSLLILILLIIPILHLRGWEFLFLWLVVVGALVGAVLGEVLGAVARGL